jgi:hypothetical protein
VQRDLPVTVVLNRPPAIIPAPLTRLMSQVSEASKASRLRPLTLIASPPRSTIWTKPALLAKNTSPSPVTRINGLSSDVTIFFKSLPMLPAFSWWNSTRPW